MKITPLLITVVLSMAPVMVAFAQDQPAGAAAQPPTIAATPPAPAAPPAVVETAPSDQMALPEGLHLTPQLRARLLSQVQDIMVMSQNTAAWTPQGLVVLQGNRLLVYAPDLSLKRAVNLPVPANSPALAGAAAGSMASLIPPRIISTDRGLFIVRWQQLIRLDKDFQVVSQAMLPTGSSVTAENMGAVCPLCLRMALAMGINLAMGIEMVTPGNAGEAAPDNGACGCPATTPGSNGNADTSPQAAPCPQPAPEQNNDTGCAPAPAEQPAAPAPPTPPAAD